MSSTNGDPKARTTDWLEWTKAISTAIAAVVIPIAVLVVGNKYSAALKDRELEGKFVELAISILRVKRPGFRGGSNTGEWSHEEVPEVFA